MNENVIKEKKIDFSDPTKVNLLEVYEQLNIKEAQKERQKEIEENDYLEIPTGYAKMPTHITPIISKGYEDALKIQNPDSDGAIVDEVYLSQLLSPVNIKFTNGTAQIADMTDDNIKKELLDNLSHQNIQDVNIGLLNALFSVIVENLRCCKFTSLNQMQNYIINYGANIYIPDFLRFMGIESNLNQDKINKLWHDLARLDNIVGVRKTVGKKGKNEHIYKEIYRLLEIDSMNEIKKSVHISSPYMNQIIWELYQANVKIDKANSPYLIQGPRVSKYVSYQNPKLASLKNKRAVEIVLVIIALIEQCGKYGKPHIKVSNILAHCPMLMEALEFANKNSDRTQILKRSFSTAWEYLKLYTDLEERFGIQIPDENDVPTLSDYDTKVYEFTKTKDVTEKGA